MQIPVTLNGKNIILDAQPEERLFTVLRNQGLTSVKCACNHGMCGTCAVLVNGKPVPSCTLPVAAIQDKQVVTLEYFRETEDFQDIKNGFEQANVTPCGFCDSSKYFAAWDIISETQRPQKEDVLAYVRTLGCHCTQTASLVNAIMYAATRRRIRLSQQNSGKTNGKK